jgi:hypothetical protein
LLIEYVSKKQKSKTAETVAQAKKKKKRAKKDDDDVAVAEEDDASALIEIAEGQFSRNLAFVHECEEFGDDDPELLDVIKKTRQEDEEEDRRKAAAAAKKTKKDCVDGLDLVYWDPTASDVLARAAQTVTTRKRAPRWLDSDRPTKSAKTIATDALETERKVRLPPFLSKIGIGIIFYYSFCGTRCPMSGSTSGTRWHAERLGRAGSSHVVARARSSQTWHTRSRASRWGTG